MSAAMERAQPCPECGTDCGGTIRPVHMGRRTSATGECAVAARRRMALHPMPGPSWMDERRASPGTGLVAIDWDAPDEVAEQDRLSPSGPNQGAVIAWLEEHGEGSVKAIAAAFGWDGRKASTAAARACRGGRIERVKLGVYRLAGGC